MLMKYYSELTRRNYDTEQECIDAEKEINELKLVRKERAEEITDAIKEAEEALKVYHEKCDVVSELRNKFIKDYGSFNMSYKTIAPTNRPRDIFEFIESLFF